MVEYPIFLDNDETCWFEFKYFPVYDATNQLIGINLNAYNIDKRKKAEEKITISENKLSAFYNSSTDSHILLDKDLKIIAFNKSAREMSLSLYGKEIKEGKKMTDFVLPEALIDLQTNFARALGGEKRMLERERYFEKTQEKIWILINYFPVYDSQNNILGVALHTVNITNLKQKEAKIRLQNKMLKEIAWQQSHEVRKPVANILGLINILRITNNLADANEREEYLQHLYQASNELDAVIHKIVEKAGILYRKELFKPI
jgi:PAS domain S-box-containing protein